MTLADLLTVCEVSISIQKPREQVKVSDLGTNATHFDGCGVWEMLSAFGKALETQTSYVCPNQSSRDLSLFASRLIGKYNSTNQVKRRLALPA